MSQSSRPIVGINMDLHYPQKNKQGQLRLASGYCDRILEAGGFPIVMPAFTKDADLDAFLSMVDGMVMTGGADMDPRRNSQPMHPSVRMIPERREDSDRLLVRKLIETKKPLLGIGLGMQQINVALGGSLFLHLPEELPKALPHFDASDDFHRHLALIKADTYLMEIYGGEEMRINSNHHQAVKNLGNGLRVCAVAPDGVIEAIEYMDPSWFCIGVQWHPQSDNATALDTQLFECFVQACAGGYVEREVELAA